MGKDKLITLAAEPGASLSGGSLRLYAQAGEAIVGCVDLYAHDPLNRRCAVGIAVATAHRRRGYALAMLAEAARMGREVFGLRQLYADIAAPNAASIALFARAGYAQCGLFRQWLWVEGQGYIDNIRMQLML